MIAVMFEFWVDGAKADRYFSLAEAMRSEVDKADGFISVERFESISERGKFVSLSFWRDRDAVNNWYMNTNHKKAQGEGRSSVLTDYRLRVAEVFRDYDMAQGRPENAQ